MSLADLSVGSGAGGGVGVGYNSATPGQHQDYTQTHASSIPSNHNSATQLGDFMGGGDSLNWPSSSNNPGIIRHQSASIPAQQNHHYASSEQRKRGESIDMFLSRSPSQSLGSEFLKFRNDETTPSIPHLSLDMSHSNHGSMSRSNSIGLVGQSSHGNAFNESNNAPKPNHSRQSSNSEGIHNNANDKGGNHKHNKDSSPSCSVTGTSASSRSASPSWNSGLHHDGMRKGSMTGGLGHTINQYHSNVNTSAVQQANIGTQGQHYSQDINSSYESFSSTNHQLYGGGNSNNSYESRQGIRMNTNPNNPVNSNFNLSSGGMEASQENYQSLNNSGHNFRSSAREEYPFPRQQVMPQGYNASLGDNSLLKQPAQKQSLPKETKPQQQVFYMAVPTEDGQGQVLQPIQMQMVQIPGQPNAFVLPAAPHGSNIVGVAPMSIGGGGVGFQNSPTHPERKNYNYMQNSRQVLDIPGNQYYEDNNNHGHVAYAEDTAAYGDKHYRAGRVPGETSRRDSVSNATNDLVANLYASPQRPPLRELLGHVRRLSRDQVGCRLLQQALDEEGASAASMILKEGLSFWGEAMVDPFGNYLFQKILEKITAEERIVLVQNVSPRLVNASLNLHGTRSVQKVVELCAIDEKDNAAASNGDQKQETASEILTRSLTPAAARLCIDSHGNHVIQRILLKLPYQYSHFVFDAVANSVGDVARHRHGCCVIQRCLDSPPSTARSNLVHRIVEKSLELMQDAYGNYVVQYVLDVCSDDDVHAVCESVVGKVNLLAIQKFSSNVMEKCLERCTDKVRELYLAQLSDSERIRELMMDPFGNYVIQRALAVSTHAQAVQLVEAMKPHLFSSTGGGIKNTAGGRRILAKISKRFPNFSLGDDFGDNEPVLKSGHKKNNSSRHDNSLSGEQASARFNRRGQGKSDEHNG